MTKFIVNNRTDSLKTDINLFFYDNKLSNCARSLADASHEFQIHVSLRILTIKISQWARVNFCSYRKNQIFTLLDTRLTFYHPLTVPWDIEVIVLQGAPNFLVTLSVFLVFFWSQDPFVIFWDTKYISSILLIGEAGEEWIRVPRKI